MTRSNSDSVLPVCVRGSKGPLLGMYFVPMAEPSHLGDILLAPAFAEEMNRCRAMVAMQARRFAEMGIGTLVLDLYGTGDSAGEYADATWDLWLDDLGRGIDWLRTFGNGCQTLWGIRTGAILATDVARLDSEISNLLFWQPVASGKSYFTQFLRIRIAAEIEQVDGIKSTEQLRKMAQSGETIEVSGYAIGTALARDLDRIALPDASELVGRRVGWFETLASAEASVPRANETLATAYRDAGIRIDLEKVMGPSFWHLHERTVAPELLDSTTQVVSRWSAEGVAKGLVGATAGRDGSENSRPTTAPTSFARPFATLSHAAKISETRLDDVAAAEMGVPCVFACESDSLTGILHTGSPTQRRGVVIVVAGGPQYRIGAHRQFVALARRLSAAGYPVLRFDLRGMGDSSGTYVGFQHSESDIRAAIDCLRVREPSVEDVVLFGECESASGILFYAHTDARVKGIVLVNPWVRTEGGRAEVIIKHYYVYRVLSPEFWRKVFSGKFNPVGSLRSLIDVVGAYARGRALRRHSGGPADEDISTLPLPVATGVGLRRFRGAVLILMSGRDYIAREFDEVVKSSRAWEGLLENPRVQRRDLKDADHTFSREVWKRQATDWIREWLAGW